MDIDEIRLDLIEALKQAGEYILNYQGPSTAAFSDFNDKDEFTDAIAEAIARLEQKDDSRLKDLQAWFLPSGDWDDLTQNEEIGNRVSGLVNSYLSLKREIDLLT